MARTSDQESGAGKAERAATARRTRGRPVDEPDDDEVLDDDAEAAQVVHGADLILAMRILGYGGLVPFFAAALAAWVQPAARLPIAGQVAYAATILSFLGAIHWGLALARQERPRPERPGIGWITWGIVPALIAWFALLGPAPWNLAVLTAGFILVLAMDLISHRKGNLPRWYIWLRIQLTAGAVLACGATMAAALVRSGPGG